MNKLTSVVLLFICVGCGQKSSAPVFTLSVSEYPSWIAFAVASDAGLINGAKGKLGPIEKKWNVDVVLKLADYDVTIQMYSNDAVDAVCMTALDSLAPSIGRHSVVILPTSTSDGADTLIVVNDSDKLNLKDFLKDNPTSGLEKSVSEYVWQRNIQLMGLNPDEYEFKNMDPAAAAQAMQTNQPNINAIMVWNPFSLQTLRTRKDSRVGFDSTTIPEEVIDCVVMGEDSLKREGGENFACAVIETYYEVNKLMADPVRGDEIYLALGSKFSSLGLDDMKLVCKQTKFYSTPDEALKLFNDKKFQEETMPRVVNFCIEHEIVPEKSKSTLPRFAFEQDALLKFTTKYIEKVKNDDK